MTIDTNEPTSDFPGEWLVFFHSSDDEVNASFPSLNEARVFVDGLLFRGIEKASIYWAASPNDPRIGQVGFTSFYRWRRG